MTNPHKGEVRIEAGGQSYVLSYSANALVELEEALDRPLEEIMAMLMPSKDDDDKRQPPRLRDLRIMFWAALLDHQPDTTIEDAKRILSHVAPVDMGRLIGEAMVLAMPSQPDGGEDRPPMPDQANGTGPASSTLISTQAVAKKPSGDRRLVS